MSDMEELETEAQLELEREQWERHVAEAHAEGKCEFSGYPMKQCVLGVCDCGMEFVADERLDVEIERVLRGDDPRPAVPVRRDAR